MQELNNGQNAAVGVVLGAIEVMIDQPTIYWKNAIQQDLPFTFNPKMLSQFIYYKFHPIYS